VLAWTSKDVRACISVSEEVKKSMLDIVVIPQQNLLKKSISREESNVGYSENATKRPSEEEIEHSSNIFNKRGTQSTIRRMTKRMHVKRLLGFSTIMLFLLM